jgi:AcrR family transcriptional regulator
VTSEVTADAPPSRRQAHKLRTERALQQAALELFSKNGYDTTTTDEIAEQAGVSPRTFFRYFPTKESVLFVGEYGWFQSFTEHFLAQPAELSDVEAARQTLLELAPVLVKIRKALRQYEQAVESSPTLRGGVLSRQAEDIARMADAIAARRGMKAPDEACLLLANVLLVTYRRALFRWLAGPAATDPREVISEEIDLLVAALAAA